MADIHIDDFYRDCALTLLRLYNFFPRKCTLYVDDIISPEHPDEFGIPTQRHLACFGCMIWLAEEGYARYEDTIRHDALDQIVLTQTSFIKLSGLLPTQLCQPIPPQPADQMLPPSVAEQQATLAQQLRNAINHQQALMVKHLLRYFFNQELPPPHT
ncbi:hypothetical protein [Zooshikella sp. RANM57]|uniref:hypothetical protein n=1 Tax=Zooshikella sp. RANM57 TaxID=3425863 RepID=UPI003D6F8BCA